MVDKGRGGQRGSWAPVMAGALVTMVLGIATAARGAGGDLLWQYNQAQAGKQEGLAAAVAGDGRTVVTGYTTGEDILTTCFKADGSGVLWTATVDLNGGNDRGTAVVVDHNGDVVVAGQGWNGLDYDVVTVKYDGTTGATLWQHTYQGAGNGNDYPRAVAVDSQDNVYVGGITQGAAGNEDFLLLKFRPSGPEADGNPQWSRTWDGGVNDNDGVTAITAGVDFVAVTGYSRNGADSDWRTIRYDLSGGLEWSKALDSTSGDDRPLAAAVDGSGNVVVSGYLANGANTDIHTVLYQAADGAVLWSRTYDGGLADEPRALTVAGTDVYLTGLSYSLAGANDLYVARLDGATGAVTWEKTYDSGGGNGDVGLALTVSGAGDVVAVGYSQNFGADKDVLVAKFASGDGTPLWQRTYDSGVAKDDIGLAVSEDGTGTLRLGGWSDKWTAGSSDYDFQALAYDLGLLNAPSSLAAIADSTTQVSLTWQDNSANEDGFKIFRDDGAGYVQVGSVGANVTSYTDTGLTAHTWYSYQVRATAAAVGDSEPSNTATVLTTVLSYDAPAWVYTYDSTDHGDDFGRAVAVGGDGHPVATGTTLTAANGSLPSDDYLTVKIDRSDGSLRWQAQYNDPDDEMDHAVGVAVDGSDDVYVTGNSSLFGGVTNTNDLFTRKYLATGPADGPPTWGDPYVWDDAYNGPGNGDDRGVAVVAVPTGGIAVTGYGRNGSGNDDVYLIRYNAGGSSLWTATPFDNGDNDYPAALAADGAGNVYLGGRTNNGTDDDILLRRYQAADGSPGWTVTADVAAGNDSCAGLAVDDNGDLYAALTVTNASGNSDIRLAKYNPATGAEAWHRDHDGPAGGDDTAVAVAVDRLHDQVLVGGSHLAAVGDRDFHLRRYDANGALVWEKTLERPGVDDVLVALTVDLSGNACLAGYANESGNDNVITVCYDADGNLIGSGRYNGAANGDDRPAAMAVNNHGEPFVTGYTTTASGDGNLVLFPCPVTQVAAPVDLAATPSYTTVTLSWTDNALDEDRFEIQRFTGTCDSGGTFVHRADTNADAVSFFDSGLLTGTTYCYRVRSHTATGVVSPWVTVQATTGTPAAPAGLTATVVDTTTIDLSWTDTTSGESEFVLERCSGSGCTDFTAIAYPAANSTSYTDTTVCQGQTYRYRILARAPGDWVSPYSSPTPDTTTPAMAAPTGFTATRVSEGEILLSWTDNSSDESGFEVERCTGSGCSAFGRISTRGADATSFSDTDSLAPDTTYRYRIRAVKTATCGWTTAYAPPAEATTTLVAPSGFAAAPANTTTVDLSWTDNTGFETGFAVERCQGAGCTTFAPLTTTAAEAETASDDTACENTTYRYRVRAVKESGSPTWNSAWAGPVETTTPAAVAPVLLGVSRVDEETISVTWTDTTSDETGFEIQRCQGAGCDFSVSTTFTVGAGVTAYSDTGLSPDTTYRYRVRAVKTATCAWNSPWSAAGEATTTLTAPGAVTATATDTTTVDLAWTDTTAFETGFEIQRCSPGGCVDFATTDWTGAGATAATDTGVCAGTAYDYRVRAVNQGLADHRGGCWSRRAPLTLTGFVANSLVRFTVTYDTDMQADFADLRFFDGTAGVELDHWIEEYTPGVSAAVWLLTGANNDVVMYYGNPEATDDGDPDGLFLFYDDFTGTTIDTAKWVEIDPDGSISQNDDLLLSYINPNWSRALISQATFARTPGRTVYMRVQTQDGPSTDRFMAGWEKDQTTSASYMQGAHVLYWNNSYFKVYEYGSDRGYGTYTTYSRSNTEYESKILLKDPGATYLIRGGGYATWRQILDLNNYSASPLRVAIHQYSHQAAIHLVAVTDYPIPDTTISIGAEEQTGTCYTFANSWASPWGTAATVTTASPAAPSALNAVATSESEIDLTWTDNTSDETGMVVERCQGAGCSDFAVVATLAADTTSYHDTGLSQSTTYTYRVKAEKASSCPWSAASGTSEATTMAPPPPSGLTAAGVNTTDVDLSWTDNTGTESGFIVERCQGSGCSGFSEVGRAAKDATAYTDTSSCAGTTYTYRVKAFNELSGDGGGSWSRRAPVTITGFQPDFPTRLVVPFDSDMQADYDDLRLYDETAQTELPLWIQSYDGASATVWFRTASNDTINLYYGNPQATGVSDGNAVFDAFASNQTVAFDLAGDTANTPAWVVEALITADTLATSGPQITFDITGNGSEKSFVDYEFGVGAFRRYDRDAAGTFINGQTDSYPSYPLAAAKLWQLVVDGNSYTFSFDGSQRLSATNLPYNHGTIRIGGWSTGDSGTVHWARLRPYLASEPAASLGAEEVTTTPAPWYSGPSNTAEATTDSLPVAVTLNASRTSEVEISLSWNDTASDETGYRVERCQGSGCSSFAEITVTDADATGYADTGLTANTTYRYRVRATKTSSCPWDGPYSNESADVTTSVTPPDTFTASATDTTTVHLAWNDHTASETGFEIERCAGGGCTSFAPLATAAADATSYDDTTAAHSTTYRYRVRAVGPGWQSAWAGPSGDTTTPTPAPPDGLVASRVSETTIDLSWNDQTADETGFEIERCTGSDCSDFAPLATTAADATSYSDSGLVANTTYRYRVRAVKSATVAWATAFTTPAEATTTVLAPGGLAGATPNTTQVDLSWTDTTVSETGFEVERCQGAGCSAFSPLASLAADTTSYSDTTVCSGQTYSYRVRAMKSAAWNGPWAQTGDVTPPLPAVPTDLTAVAVSEDEIDLSWTDTTSDESGFDIERCTGAGCSDFLALASTGSDVAAYADTGLSASTTYCYRVKAVKLADCPWSTAFSTPSCDLSIQAAPTALSATALDSMRIQLDWTDNAVDETGYRIEEKIWNGRWVTLDTTAAGATSYTATFGVEAEKTYTYRVRAVRDSDISAPSNEASATTPAYQATDTSCP